MGDHVGRGKSGEETEGRSETGCEKGGRADKKMGNWKKCRVRKVGSRKSEVVGVEHGTCNARVSRSNRLEGMALFSPSTIWLPL